MLIRESRRKVETFRKVIRDRLYGDRLIVVSPEVTLGLLQTLNKKKRIKKLPS